MREFGIHSATVGDCIFSANVLIDSCTAGVDANVQNMGNERKIWKNVAIQPICRLRRPTTEDVGRDPIVMDSSIALAHLPR